MRVLSNGKRITYKTDFSHVNLLILLIADSAQTEYRSTFHCVSVCVQAWHLNFSQLFDDFGHENHVFSESMQSVHEPNPPGTL